MADREALEDAVAPAMATAWNSDHDDDRAVARAPGPPGQGAAVGQLGAADARSRASATGGAVVHRRSRSRHSSFSRRLGSLPPRRFSGVTSPARALAGQVGHQPLELVDPRRQPLQRVGDGRARSPVDVALGLRPLTRTGCPGLPTTVESAGTSWIPPSWRRSSRSGRPRSDQQLGAGAHHDVVADGRVALAALEAGPTQRDALVERHVVADLGGLADHHAGAVVDEQRLADLGRRMDLHTRDHAAGVGQRARRQRQAGVVQRVRHPVGQQRLHAAIGDQDLSAADGARRGVAVLRGGQVGAHLARHPGQSSQSQHYPQAWQSGAPRGGHECLLAGQSVDPQQPIGQRRAHPAQQLQRLQRLQRADTPAIAPSTPASRQPRRAAGGGSVGNMQR